MGEPKTFWGNGESVTFGAEGAKQMRRKIIVERNVKGGGITPVLKIRTHTAHGQGVKKMFGRTKELVDSQP